MTNMLYDPLHPARIKHNTPAETERAQVVAYLNQEFGKAGPLQLGSKPLDCTYVMRMVRCMAAALRLIAKIKLYIPCQGYCALTRQGMAGQACCKPLLAALLGVLHAGLEPAVHQWRRFCRRMHARPQAAVLALLGNSAGWLQVLCTCPSVRYKASCSHSGTHNLHEAPMLPYR